MTIYKLKLSEELLKKINDEIIKEFTLKIFLTKY